MRRNGRHREGMHDDDVVGAVEVEAGGVKAIGQAQHPWGVGLVGLKRCHGGGAIRRVAQESERAQTEG